MTDISATNEFGQAALNKMRFINDAAQVDAAIEEFMVSLRGHSRKVIVRSDHPHAHKLKTAFDAWRVPHRLEYVEVPRAVDAFRDILDRPKAPRAC